MVLSQPPRFPSDVHSSADTQGRAISVLQVAKACVGRPDYGDQLRDYIIKESSAGWRAITIDNKCGFQPQTTRKLVSWLWRKEFCSLSSCTPDVDREFQNDVVALEDLLGSSAEVPTVEVLEVFLRARPDKRNVSYWRKRLMDLFNTMHPDWQRKYKKHVYQTLRTWPKIRAPGESMVDQGEAVSTSIIAAWDQMSTGGQQVVSPSPPQTRSLSAADLCHFETTSAEILPARFDGEADPPSSSHTPAQSADLAFVESQAHDDSYSALAPFLSGPVAYPSGQCEASGSWMIDLAELLEGDGSDVLWRWHSKG